MAVNPEHLAIAYSVVQLTTIIITLSRLAFRLKIQRLWWEDMWAAVAMAGMTLFAILHLLCFYTKNFDMNNTAGLISSYVFTSIVWSVRMSLLYSIIRVVLPSTALRAVMHATGAIFIVNWALLISLKTWWYVRKQHHRPQSWSLLDSMEIFEVTVDFASDTTLIIYSLRLIWGTKLPRRRRRMILSIFFSSAMISMVSLPHATAKVYGHDVLAHITLNLELIISLIVCNLLVVVTYTYRVFVREPGSESSSEDDDFTTPMQATRGTQSLTTVDLNTPDPTATTESPRSTSLRYSTPP